MLLGVALSCLGMTFLSSRLARGRAGTAGLGARAPRRDRDRRSTTSARGSRSATSFALGELQLGTFLIVGFMIHNVTEGLGDRRAGRRRRGASRSLQLARPRRRSPAAPTILGAWIGGYASSDVLGVLFFAIAAGAALQVVVEVGRYVARRAPGGLRSGYVIGGFLAGIAAMYVTGLLVG